MKISRTSRAVLEEIEFEFVRAARAYVLGVRGRSRAHTLNSFATDYLGNEGSYEKAVFHIFYLFVREPSPSCNFVPCVSRYPVHLTVDNVQSNIYIYYWSIVHIVIEIFIDIRAILGQRSLGNVLSGYPSLLRTPLFTEYIQHVRW